METIGFIVGIIGLIIGIFGLVISWRSIKRKKISNFTKNEFSIGKSLREEFSGLELKYENETVSNDLRIYKGILMNTGIKDIPENGGKNKITVVFPEGCLIRGVNVKRGNVDVKASFDQSSNKFDIYFGLLQKDECFEYDVIYEDTKSKSEKIAREMRFEYRIEDVAKEISKEQLPIEKKYRMSRIWRVLFLIFNTFMFLLIIFLFCFILFKGRPLYSSVYSNLDNAEISVYSESDTTYNVFAKGNLPFFHSGVSVPKTDFDQNFHIEIDESSDQFSLLFILFLMAWYSALLEYSCYKELTNERKSKEINSKVELLDKKR